MSYNEIAAEHKLLDAAVKKPVTSFKEFFDVVNRLFALEKACERYEFEHKTFDPRYPSGVRIYSVNIGFLRVENEERARHYKGTNEEYNLADKARDQTLYKDVINPKYDPKDGPRFYFALLLFQFGFAPFAFLIYCIRIKDEQGWISTEVFSNPMFPIYVVFWEIGIFRYRAVGLKRQVRRLLKYASITVSAVLSFGAATLKAQTKKDEDNRLVDSHTFVISGNTRYLSKYLGLDGAIFHPEPVLQSSLTVAHKSGLYANFWKSIDAARVRMNPNYGFEEDYTLGKTFEWRKRKIDVSATYFNVTPLGKLAQGDLVQESVMVSNLMPRLKFGNYLWVRNVHPPHDGRPPGGQFVHFGANRSLTLFKKAKVALGGEVIFDSGAFGFKRALISRGSGSLKVSWKKLEFDLPEIRLGKPLSHPSDGRKFEWVWGLGLSFSFRQ